MTEITFNKIKNSEDIIKNSSTQDPLKFVSVRKEVEIKRNVRKNNILKIYRQGDILFKKVPTLPSQLKEKQDKVVAEGEVTGHAHILDNGALYESLNSDSILFIKSDQKTRIVHDEHLPIKLEPGNYEVIRQREYLGPGLQKRIVRD